MSDTKGYIFLCSNSTEDECLQRLLFGGMPKYEKTIGKVNVGDTLFLYNYTAGRLQGKFQATSESALNIEADAWEGKYPWQVKVGWIERYRPLSKADLVGVIPFGRNWPKPVLSPETVSKLEALFESNDRLPDYESDFRDRFPAKYLTNDGHRVRSNAEMTIDNWLYYQEILHAYEIKVPIKESLYCDFTISIPNQKDCVYLEYWGREDNEYLKRRESKVALYQRYNLKLVELYPKDLEAINDVLPNKLRPYLPEKRFI